MRGGRCFAVAGHASQPDTFYFGSVGGGVWKTQNAGHTWYPISDEGIPIGSIGAIAVAPSNPNILYVGTGETDIRNQHSYGTGMYKSIDGGDTWKQLTGGLPTDDFVGRIGMAVSPSNPNRLWAVVDDVGSAVPSGIGGGRGAAPAEATGAAPAGGRRGAGGGVYISDNAGATWKLVNAENRL